MNQKMWKRGIAFALAVVLMVASLLPSAYASESAEDVSLETNSSMDLNCKGVILMDAATGTILYEQNADEALPPASVTKIMTLLLVMEAIESGQIKLTDMVSTSARAASMGGSQIFLEEGEQMSVEDMIKSVVIASANDAALALAEYVAGSEEEFVSRMNKRAAELGMKTARFENTNGLDDTAEDHVLSARDIAVMSRELIKHQTILEYSSIWMDTVRNGEFGLTNTNRLVRFYKGATGLKTGSTSKAKFCVSATAKRDNMHLICVVMGAPTRDERNAIAAKLFDYGFANYSLFTAEGKTLDEIKILGGLENTCGIAYEQFDCVVKKGEEGKVEVTIELEDSVSTPVEIGKEVGKVIYKIGNEVIGEMKILTTEQIPKISFLDFFVRLLAGMVLK